MFQRNKRRDQVNAAQTLQLLDACHFVVSDEGRLQIQPLNTELTVDCLATILDSLLRADASGGLTEIIFDFGRVERIGPRWTVVLAMLIGFSRGTTAACHLVLHHRQPAAAASLYRRNADLHGLIVSANDVQLVA